MLNEIEVTAAPKADVKAAKPVKLVNALADYSQENLQIAKAIDGSADDPGNGWAVHPATGVTHWATFETTEPIGIAGRNHLNVKLHHKFGEAWTLGRFRLSVTRGSEACRAKPARGISFDPGHITRSQNGCSECIDYKLPA